MSLRIADRWPWDFWTVTVGDDVHAFHLRAARAIGDGDRRHRSMGSIIAHEGAWQTPAPVHRLWLDGATAGLAG